MTNVNRAGRALALFAALLMGPAVSYADTILLNSTVDGELTEDDLFAVDTVGEFYYDVFDFTSLGTDPITITLESDDFAPYLAWGFDLFLPPWPTGSDAPYELFVSEMCLGAPGAGSVTIDAPAAGQSFQVLAATCNYNPTALGSYTLTIAGGTGGVTGVPAPGSLILLITGLAGLVLSRRREQAV